MVFNLIFIALIIAVVAFIAAAWRIADSVIKSPREVRPDDWQAAGLTPEFLRFPAGDGVELAGAFVRGTNPATILLLHGYGHSKTQLLPQAKFLHAAGFSLFLFDFRGSGESGGEFITFGEEEKFDLTGAVRYLHSRQDVDHRRLGIFGFSMGGSVALLTSAGLPEVRAIAVDSSYGEFRSLIESNFREYLGKLPFFPLGNLVLYLIKVRTGAYFGDIRPSAHLKKLKDIPLLLIHGTHDKTIPVWDTLRMHATASGPAELMIVKGAGHTGTYTTAGEKYSTKLVDFFRTHLEG